MATYFVGDIQGCFDEFKQLLAAINFCGNNDTLYLAGDLIGRGPKSLETLEFIVANQSSIHTVLGNHDLHFLAIANGIKSAKESDKFGPLLQSEQLSIFVDYLRNQPLLIDLPQHNIVLCHAGITPQWDLATANKAARHVSSQLKSDDYGVLLQQMYGSNHNDWLAAKSCLSQTVFAINALTRMRYCESNGQLDFQLKCAPKDSAEHHLTPWYQFPCQLPNDYTVIFGHWASLMGNTGDSRFLALDTGCLWGNYLTAWRLEDNQQFKIAANVQY